MNEETVPEYTVRNMRVEDFQQVMDICKELNFTIGKYENNVMINVDSEGFFVAEESGTGKILGMLTGVVHSPSLAFIGQYGVRPEHQGKGIGQNIWSKAMEHIGSEPNISLTACEVISNKYRDKCGFVHTAEQKNIRYFGIANCNRLIKHVDDIAIVEVNDNNLNEVIQYDKEICEGLSRDIFLKQYTKTPETIFFAAINNSKEIKGYCIMTTSACGAALPQPLYADTKEIAELLMVKCCELMPIASTNGIIYQTFDCNKNATELALKMDLKNVLELPLLFTKKIINGDLQKIYCNSGAVFYPF